MGLSHQVSVTLPAQRDDEFLLELLDEVIYQLDAADGVALDAAVTDIGDTRAQIRQQPWVALRQWCRHAGVDPQADL